MLETTPNRQQCIKVTIKTDIEYFINLAEDIGDMHSLIYIHQALKSLCILRKERVLNIFFTFEKNLRILKFFELA